MEKRKAVSLTSYVTRILLGVFAGFVGTLVLAFLLLQGMILWQMIVPANAGERAAQAEIKQLKQLDEFPKKLQPSYYEYVYFDPQGQVISSSLSGEKLARELENYSDMDKSYTTGEYVRFKDGSRCLLTWRYQAQFTNGYLRQAFPNAEQLFMILVGIILVLFFILYSRWISRKLSRKLNLVEVASQQMMEQNLEESIDTQTGIREFNQALESMEDLRKELRTSLLNQWEMQQQQQQEIAALTHDIKTPLTIVNGNAELLLEGEGLEGEQRQLIQSILQAGGRAKRYVGGLQQLANFEILSETKEQLSVDSLVKELYETLMPLAQAKQVKLVCQIEKPIQPIVGSAIILIRALVCLGENAIRYTDKGEVVVRVYQTERMTHFIFEDQGPGFSDEALQHATKMFWQEDKSRTGTATYGIGLATVEKAAQLHGGKLILENMENGARTKLSIRN